MFLLFAILTGSFSLVCSTVNNPYKKSLYFQQLADTVNQNPSIPWTAKLGRGTETLDLQTDEQAISLTQNNGSDWRRHAISKRQLDNSQGIDWRRGNRLVAPQHQGSCGSCWAFSAMHALADRLALRHYGFYYSSQSLSAQHVLECCNYWYCSGCNGASDNAAGFEYVKQHYTVYDSCRPYDGSSWYCYNHCPAASVPLKGYERLSSNQEDIKNALRDGPVIATLNAYHDLWAYSSGIYQQTGGIFVSVHSVEIVGYGSEGGWNYWIVKNSWGQDWGEGGYFRILRGVNHCGIEENVIAPIVDDRSFTQGTDAPLRSSVGGTTVAQSDNTDVLEAANYVANELRPFCQDGHLDSLDLEQSKDGEAYTVDKVQKATRKGVQGISYSLLIKLSLPRCSKPSLVQASVFLTPQGEYRLLGQPNFIDITAAEGGTNVVAMEIVLLLGTVVTYFVIN